MNQGRFTLNKVVYTHAHPADSTHGDRFYVLTLLGMLITLHGSHLLPLDTYCWRFQCNTPLHLK